MKPYIEVAVYRLKPNVTVEQFLETADENLAAFRQLKGFLHRELVGSEDGQWLDLVYYESREAAEAAEPILSAAPTIQTIMGMLDMENGQWFHATAVRHYSSLANHGN